jgi:hypothetical protein
MPVDSKHPQVEQTSSRWSRVRDVRAGSDAVKHRGEVYLPRLSGQTWDDYEQYRFRAMFLPVVARTVQTLVGLAGMKRPELVAPGHVEELAPAIGSEGQPLERIVATVMEELVSVGRVGALVDLPEDGTYPCISLYHCENIVNWREAKIGGKWTPVSIVLSEERLVPSDDPYKREYETIYRELAFGVPPTVGGNADERMQFAYDNYAVTPSEIESGVYYQAIWSKDRSEEAKRKKSDNYQIEEVVVPRRPGGGSFTEIPFRCFNSSHLGMRVGDVPMDHLATVNISHYLNSADLEWGRHFTALPTAWLAGFDMKGDLTIGSTRCWVADDPNAKAGFLEFTGQGLGHLQTGMEHKEREMAALGVRFLDVTADGPEKPESIRLRLQGDRAALVSIMDVVEDGVEDLLRFCCKFLSAADMDEEINFSMPRDFTETRIDPQVLSEVVKSVQSGLLSWESFVGILASSALLPDGVTADEEARRLLSGIPGGLAAPGGDMMGAEEEEPEPADATEEEGYEA